MTTIFSIITAIIMGFTFGTAKAPAEGYSDADGIVFISRRTNYAWGRQDCGTFIDAAGDVYEFDFSDKETYSDNFYETLMEFRRTETPVRRGICSAEKLREIQQKDAANIVKTAEFTKAHAACDMGQKTLYVCTADGELIKLRTEGDTDGQLQDKTAKKLCNFFDTIMLLNR